MIKQGDNKMKRNWKTSRLPESVSNQQRQQTIVEEIRHPCDTPATPVASDRNVKIELAEDKHNDSGVSFSYSTPKASGLLTSTYNHSSSSMGYDSLSTSLSIEDQTQFQYVEALASQNIREQQVDQQLRNAPSTITKPNNDDIIDPPKQCLMCSFITDLRSAYTDHVVTHFLLTNNLNIEALSEPAQLADTGSVCDDTWENAEEVEDTDLPGPSKRPKSTIKRKSKDVKCKRCKECDYVATSKLQYWVHLRSHINDNGYGCVSCPFVTKYKHHMAHHWFSMHDNLKLFHCSKCTYSCVSKSMLSSHMKTHSNVYQYNCGSCSYKTKFFNAIKKHLQDTMHIAGTILDADGKPNPAAILDVFGNKRGPRCKSYAKDNINQNNWSSVAVPTSQIPNASRLIAEVNGMIRPSQDKNTGQDLSLLPLSYFNEPMINWLNVLKNGEDVTSVTDTQYDNLQWTIFFNYMHARMVEKQRILKELLKFDTDNNISDLFNDAWSPKTDISEIIADEPLDLSMPDVNVQQQQQQQQHLRKSATYIPNISENGEIKMENGEINRERETNPNQNETHCSTIPGNLTSGGSDLQDENQQAEDLKNYDKINSNTYTCLFCQIGFANKTMYYDHISYHSSLDPFVCNKCGSKCTNNVDFYVHLIKMKH